MKRQSLFLSLLLLVSSVHSEFKCPTTTEEALTFCQQTQSRFVEVLFSDIRGTLKSLTFPLDKAEGPLNKGAFFDGSSIQGCTNINESDLLAQVDFSGFFLSPWDQNISTAYIFSDMYTSPTELYQDSARTALKNAVEKAKTAGFAINMGIELEFFLLKEDKDGNLVQIDNNAYCDALADTQLDTFKNALLNGLFLSGIDVEKAHHEVAPGQYEIVLRYNDPVRVADSLLLAKYIITRAAKQFGNYHVSFMAKPFEGQNGNGMHVHCSAWNIEEKRNAFYNPETNGLSDTALNFIGGNVAYLQEMTLLFNATVNSYKRLVPGYEAPVYLSWGYKNRSTAIRIPETNIQELVESNGAPVRMEFRSADPSCNPYLLFAGIINAGLEGIAKGISAPSCIEQNLYKSTQEEREALNIKIIPSSLAESVTLFKESAFMKETLGESLHGKLVSIKENEWNDYIAVTEHNPLKVSEWEKKYHNLI